MHVVSWTPASSNLCHPWSHSSAQAREAIHGRMFAGSTVEAVFLQPQDFLDAIAPPEAPAAAAAPAAEAAAAEAAAPMPEDVADAVPPPAE